MRLPSLLSFNTCGKMLTLFVLALLNHRSAKSIFTNYQNDTGWDSKAYVYMLGWTLTTVATGMEGLYPFQSLKQLLMIKLSFDSNCACSGRYKIAGEDCTCCYVLEYSCFVSNGLDCEFYY